MQWRPGVRLSTAQAAAVRQQPPPDWVETVELTSESDGKKLRTVLCQDEATLVYLANLGCIELNTWNARIDTLDKADYAGAAQ